MQVSFDDRLAYISTIPETAWFQKTSLVVQIYFWFEGFYFPLFQIMRTEGSSNQTSLKNFKTENNFPTSIPPYHENSLSNRLNAIFVVLRRSQMNTRCSLSLKNMCGCKWVCMTFSFIQVYFSANINSGIPNYEFSPAEKVLFVNVFCVMIIKFQ